MANKSGIRNSSKTALGGIIAALSVTTMFLTAVFTTLSYALPAAAGILLVVVVIDVDKKWAFGVYAATALLALLVLPNKEAAVMYVFFFGHYPIVKAVLEKRLRGVLLWVVKFVIFNVSVVLAYVIILYVFQLPFEDMEKYGKWAVWILLAMGNVVFVLYDIALSRLVTLYMLKWRKSFRKLFKYLLKQVHFLHLFLFSKWDSYGKIQ